MIFFVMTGEDKWDETQVMNRLYEQLIADMAPGNLGAFEKLYLHSKPAVFGFSLSILKNAQDAEDVMQDTYVRVFHAAKSYKPQGKPMAWILTIVRNLSLMKLRADKKAPVPLKNNLLSASMDEFTENSIDRKPITSIPGSTG